MKIRSLGAASGWLVASLVVSKVQAGLPLAEAPLFLVNDSAPNVLLNLSVEGPVGGSAYNDQPNVSVASSDEEYCEGRQWVYFNDWRGWQEVGTCFNPQREYLGYFDSDKCYSYGTSGSIGFFRPASFKSSATSCGGVAFDGNFLNWSTMTALDMFTLAMTGGDRVRDTNAGGSTYNTILQRSRHSWWMQRKMFGKNVRTTQAGKYLDPGDYTPYTGVDNMLIEHGYHWDGTQMVPWVYFRDFDYDSGNNRFVEQWKNPWSDWDRQVRVAACVNGLLEENCVKYGSVYKPEGLIQENKDSMRFAVSSYLNDNSDSRDGGVIRVKMKHIGAKLPDGSANANAEITADGIHVLNPDGESGYTYSGVLNYVNRFSHLADYKSKDPISELYYEGLRYLMGFSAPTPEYISSSSSYDGGMPVQTTWTDPWQHSCQRSFIVGLNDANPWYDKRVPGTSFTSASVNGHPVDAGDYGEPSTASTFKAVAPSDFATNIQSAINATTLTNLVGSMQGINGTSQCIGCVITGTCDNWAYDKTISGLGGVMGTCPAPQKQNSYYIAGLAYMANTWDVRPDLDGVQNIETFMVDTQEYQTNPLVGEMNMLWLAGKYGGFTEDEDNENFQPDEASEWDRDGDGEPDNYVLATNPERMIAALRRSFAEIERRSASSSSVAANSSRLRTGTYVYQATFDSASWSGDVKAYAVDVETGAISDTAAWSAVSQMPAPAARSIFTREDSGSKLGIEFEWTNLTTTQQAALNKDMDGVTDGYGQKRLAYIRGDMTVYDDVLPNFRQRESELGDITNSNPLYVGNVDFGYAQPYSGLTDAEKNSYITYRTSTNYANRSPMIYVGANDGMLHAFNASTGAEEFGYIPSELIPALSDLTDERYDHRYYVDGSTTFGDVYLSGSWKTMLIGATAGGGKSVYALDISTPDSFSETDVMWEFSDLNDSDMGNVLGKPSITRLESGDWVALVGNGLNSANDVAKLFVLNLSDGSVMAEVSTGVGSSAEPNGLFDPVPVDVDGDRDADFIYAGDMQGNLWKFEFNPNNGNFSTPTKLFTACEVDTASCAYADRQPITVRPVVVQHPDNEGMMVYFGTGSYFLESDRYLSASPRVEAYYGILDDLSNSPEIDRLSDLVEQTIETEGTFTDVNGEQQAYRISSENEVDYTSDKGWYIKLQKPDGSGGFIAEGERINSDPIYRNGHIVFVSVIPDSDPCAAGGFSWLTELDAVSGSRPQEAILDLNNDGIIDEDDVESLQNGGTGPVSGLGGEGFDTGTTVIENLDGKQEQKILSSSSGGLKTVTEKGSGRVYGRQSWRQLR